MAANEIATLEPSVGQIDDAEMQRFTALIYKVTGIRIPDQKTTLMSNRIRRRLRATGLESYAAYFERLRKLPTDDPEWDAFLQEVTTHETYLFRDEAQWNWFRENFLADVVKQARAGKRPRKLRIWSAAASTGDEAYTIACCIADRITDAASWKISIVGTDVGIGALEQAKRGRFDKRAMRLVPDKYRRRFFDQCGDEEAWKIKPTLASWTQFRQHNLLEKLPEPAFDVVFLKNVLIYFDKQSKGLVMEHLLQSLGRDGYLVSGPAEGISEFVAGYDRPLPWLWRRKQ